MCQKVVFDGWCYRDTHNEWHYFQRQKKVKALDKKVILVSKTLKTTFECIVIRYDASRGWKLLGEPLNDDSLHETFYLRTFTDPLQRVFLACYQDGTPLPDCDEDGINPALDYGLTSPPV